MTTDAQPPPGAAGSAFTTGEGLNAGLSSREIFGSAYARPHYGIRTVDQPATPEELARAYLPRMRAWQAFGDTTAAVFWGLPLPQRLRVRMTVHVVVPTGRNAPKGNRLAARRRSPERWERVQHLGVPLAAPALTWGAPVAHPLGRGARRRRRRSRVHLAELPLASPPVRSEHPRQRVHERPTPLHAPGAQRHERQLGANRGRRPAPPGPPADSRGSGVAAINGDAPGARRGRFPRACGRSRRLPGRPLPGPRRPRVPEVPDRHRVRRQAHWTEEQALKDIARINRIQQAGWLVIRVTRQQLANPAEFFAQVRAALKRAQAKEPRVWMENSPRAGEGSAEKRVPHPERVREGMRRANGRQRSPLSQAMAMSRARGRNAQTQAMRCSAAVR